MRERDQGLDSYLRWIPEQITSDEETERLSKAAPSGRRDAYMALAQSQLRFVVAIIFGRFHEVGSLTFLDLIQEGNLAMIKCLAKHKTPSNVKTLIYVWVKGEVSKAVQIQHRLVKLSSLAIKELYVLRRAERQLRDLGIDPTVEDLAVQSGLPEDRVKFLTDCAAPPVSLDADEIRDAIEANSLTDSQPSADEVLDLQELRERLLECLSSLNELDRVIIAARFGLTDDGIQGVESLAKRFRTTRREILEIQDRALRRLKHPERLSALRDFTA
jgi:RNA polymerase primary sigma factor